MATVFVRRQRRIPCVFSAVHRIANSDVANQEGSGLCPTKIELVQALSNFFLFSAPRTSCLSQNIENIFCYPYLRKSGNKCAYKLLLIAKDKNERNIFECRNCWWATARKKRNAEKGGEEKAGSQT